MTPVQGIGIGEVPTLTSSSGAVPRTEGISNGPSFADTLGQAIGAVDQAQLDADTESQKAALGAGNLHEATLALEKADITMRLAMKVRNKVIDAYQEVMRMSV